MADDKPLLFSQEHKALIRDTLCSWATEDEFATFIHVCQRHKLDPMLKEIYPVKKWDRKLSREVLSIQTGIDGFRVIAERTGNYAPGKEPTYEEKDGTLISATAYLKKRTEDGTWHEIAAKAYYSEYVQLSREGKPTAFWLKMPHNQLGKCAEALALRKAFPNVFAGLYTFEEMAQATTPEEEESKSPQAKEETPLLISLARAILYCVAACFTMLVVCSIALTRAFFTLMKSSLLSFARESISNFLTRYS